MTRIQTKAKSHTVWVLKTLPRPIPLRKIPVFVWSEIKAQFPATLPFCKILSKAKTIKKIQGKGRKYISIFFITMSGGKVEGVGSEMSRADVTGQ